MFRILRRAEGKKFEFQNLQEKPAEGFHQKVTSFFVSAFHTHFSKLGPDLSVGTASICPGPPHFRGPNKSKVQFIIPHRFMGFLVFYMTSRIFKYSKRFPLVQCLFIS